MFHYTRFFLWLVLLASLLINPITLKAQDINGVGATFPAPLYMKWFQEYQAKTGVRVYYQAIGSGMGIKSIIARSVDFGASDVPMTDAEMQDAPGILHLPMIAHAIVMVYNLPSIHAKLRLTGPLVAAIYLGQITRWNDPQIAKINPGLALPDLAINPVYQSGGSGTTSILTTYLSDVSPTWKDKMGAGISVRWPVGMGGKQCAGVAQIVETNPGGLGYMELSNAVTSLVPYAAIQNAKGNFVYATVESAAMGASAVKLAPDLRGNMVNSPAPLGYPIIGYTYLLVNRNVAKSQVKDLIKWMLIEGQRDAASLDYVPLPLNVRKQALAALTSSPSDIVRRKHRLHNLRSNIALHLTPPPRSSLRFRLACLGGVTGELVR